jgi:hypothetical protein
MDTDPIQVTFNLTLNECAEYCMVEKLCLSFDFLQTQVDNQMQMCNCFFK